MHSTSSQTDTFGTETKCPSYRESNKDIKERQGPTLGVRSTEVSVLVIKSRLVDCQLSHDVTGYKDSKCHWHLLILVLSLFN